MPDLDQPSQNLGFDRDSTNSFVDGGASADYLVSTNVIDLNRENTVIVRCNFTDNGGLLQEVFASNPLDFSAISYLNPDPKTITKKIAKMTLSPSFQITTENGDILPSLNGQNTVFSLLYFNPDKPEKQVNKDIATIKKILAGMFKVLTTISNGIKSLVLSLPIKFKRS